MLALIGSASAFVFQTGLLAILAWLVGWAAGFFFSAHTVWLLEMATLTMIPAGILCLYVFWEWQEQERRRQRVAKTSLESEERRKQVESQRQGQQKRIEERHLKRLNQLSKQIDMLRQSIAPREIVLETRQDRDTGRSDLNLRDALVHAIDCSLDRNLARYRLIRYLSGDDPELGELLCGRAYPDLSIPTTGLRNQVAAIERSISRLAKPPEGEERGFFDEIANLPDLVGYDQVSELWDRISDAIRRQRKWEQELQAVEVDDDTGPPYYNEALRRLYRIKNALRVALISRSQHQGLLEVS